MTIEIVVPQVGEAVAEVILVQWFKEEGDPVRQGEPLFEVDTDKVTVEIEAFADGHLHAILAPAGAAVMPQQVVGLLAPAGSDTVDATEAESEPEPEAESATRTPTPATDSQANTNTDTAREEQGRISPVAQRIAHELTVPLEQVAGSGLGGRITADDVRRFVAEQQAHTGSGNVDNAPPLPTRQALASPKARRRARELGVELAGVSGTGADGLIRVSDVEAALARQQSCGATRTRPMSKLRQAIAANTQASKQTVPHFYLTADVDMTLSQQLRTFCDEARGWPKPPTYTDLLVRAAALALDALPACNMAMVDGEIVQRTGVDIGVVVSVPDGLLTPVLANAHQRSLAQVSAQLREVAQRARDNRLRAEDMGTKSIVISNLGMYAVDSFSAIIEQPAPMILAVGRITDRVVAVDARPVVRPMCTITLSVDHRVLDGVPAAQFLTQVVRHLEQPFGLLHGPAAAKTQS